MNVQRTWTIRPRPPARPVRRLLADAGLPTADLDEAFEHFIGGWSGDELDGVVGMELYAEVALLRSLAVTPAARGRRLGTLLVEAGERYGRAQGVRTVFLLTESARGFFEGLGYSAVERSAAPPAIRGSREFSDLCPASAVLMSRAL